MSGDKALDIASSITGIKLQPRLATYVDFLNAEKQTIDSGLVLYFSAPNSFTGEHVVELQGHGGPVILQLLLQRVLELGARAARPGEFSERAFLNDKIDLAQAEAIADLIDSSSTAAAQSAVRSLQGEFSAAIQQLLTQLIEIRMYVESAIDFPEEEIDFLSDKGLKAQLSKLNQTLKTTLEKTQTGVVLNQGISIAIIGKPNAGKSSLLNCLTEEDTAIISEVAGTTRDVIKEDVVIAGIPVRLIDTAGIHETDNPIKQQGIQRALKVKQQADVVLHVHDGSDKNPVEFSQTNNHITVINKSDIMSDDHQHPPSALVVSAKQNLGIDLVRQAIVEQVTAGGLNENSFTARVRHIEQLKLTQIHIDAAEVQLAQNQGELSAEELRLAQTALSEITGDFSSDDLLGEIFSSCCIGK